MKETIHTSAAPAAIGPYSQGYAVNGFVYTSGQIPVDPQTGAIPQGIAAQTHQSCKNVGAILEAAGLDFTKVFKTTKSTKSTSVATSKKIIRVRSTSTTKLVIVRFLLRVGQYFVSLVYLFEFGTSIWVIFV